MAYVLGGSSGESNGFERAIANFALMAVHESLGLVNTTTVVNTVQGNVWEVPVFSPIGFQDYNPAGVGGFTGNAVEQNPALGQNSITATPAVAASAYDIFYEQTTAFALAQALGQELGESAAEKIDQRVAGAFAGFKATPGNQLYPTSLDGFARPSQLGAMELRAAGAPAGTPTAGFTSYSVLELIRNIKTNWKNSRLPGSPMIILDTQYSMNRMLGELTGGAISQTGGANLSDLGNELLRTGRIENLYGCMVMFSTFLTTASRSVAGGAPENCLVGAYYSDNAVYTLVKSGVEIRTGVKPGGLQSWITATIYMGAGVGDLRRGGAINVEIAI